VLSSNLKTYMVVCTKGNDEPMKTAFEEPLRPDVGYQLRDKTMARAVLPRNALLLCRFGAGLGVGRHRSKVV
jgi:hypothetical protein